MLGWHAIMPCAEPKLAVVSISSETAVSVKTKGCQRGRTLMCLHHSHHAATMLQGWDDEF